MRTVTLILLVLLIPLTAVAQDSALRGDPQQAQGAWMLIQEGALIIDVRSEEEFNSGALPGAEHVPYDDTQALIELIGEDPDRVVVLYCGSGRRVEIAKAALEAEGFTGIYNATGLDALNLTRPEDYSPAKPPAVEVYPDSPDH